MFGIHGTIILYCPMALVKAMRSGQLIISSLLMAYANYKIRHLTDSSTVLTILSLFGLMMGAVLILYYEISTQIQQIFFIGGIYMLLTFGSWLYSRKIK